MNLTFGQGTFDPLKRMLNIMPVLPWGCGTFVIEPGETVDLGVLPLWAWDVRKDYIGWVWDVRYQFRIPGPDRFYPGAWGVRVKRMGIVGGTPPLRGNGSF